VKAHIISGLGNNEHLKSKEIKSASQAKN